jgi:maltose-binding protein MalE
MTRRLLITAVIAVLAALAIASCGGSSSPAVSTTDAKAAIDKAAEVKTSAMTLPSGSEKGGLVAAYNNAATATNDKQLVTVLVLKDSDALDKLKDTLNNFDTGGKAKILTHENVAVVYAQAGNDHLAAVKKALNGL